MREKHQRQNIARSILTSIAFPDGSIMRGKRTQRSKMTPFSRLRESDGRPCDCHRSLSDVLLRDSTMLKSSRNSIPRRSRVLRHWLSSKRLVLKVKYPEYVRNAAICNPSPTKFLRMAWNPSLLFDQRELSWLRLFIRLSARNTFVVTISISLLRASTSLMRVAYSAL